MNLFIIEIKLDEVLSGLGLTMDEFVDLCILCGCDYCERIEGIGCIKAYQLIKEYKTIEKVNILKNIIWMIVIRKN